MSMRYSKAEIKRKRKVKQEARKRHYDNYIQSVAVENAIAMMMNYKNRGKK